MSVLCCILMLRKSTGQLLNCCVRHAGRNQMVPPCVQNEEVRQTMKQSHLSAIVQAQHFSLFARMSDKTDAIKILTASPLENWRRPPGCPRTVRMKTIQQDLKSSSTSPWMKQLTWLRIIHSGDWCLPLALHTPRGACRNWMYECMCVLCW